MQEIDVLNRISHHHVVKLIASFTDEISFSLILNPVAKDVLKSVLERQSREQPLPGMSPFDTQSNKLYLGNNPLCVSASLHLCKDF